MLRNGGTILLADSMDKEPLNEHRILVFGPPSAREDLQQVEKIYIDGTFKLEPRLHRQRKRIRRRELPEGVEEALAPEEPADVEPDEMRQRRVYFSQIVTILVEKRFGEADRKVVTPLCHSLFTRKDQATYVRMWRLVSEVGFYVPSVSPQLLYLPSLLRRFPNYDLRYSPLITRWD
jgi:hypothetical protein